MNLASIILAVAALSSSGQYQLIVQDKAFLSRDLSGIVEDTNGDAIPDAKVDLIACSGDYRSPKVVKSMQSGPKGQFHFAKKPSINEYCMQVSKSGFDQLRFSVVIAKTDRTLRVKLPVAN